MSRLTDAGREQSLPRSVGRTARTLVGIASLLAFTVASAPAAAAASPTTPPSSHGVRNAVPPPVGVVSVGTAPRVVDLRNGATPSAASRAARARAAQRVPGPMGRVVGSRGTISPGSVPIGRTASRRAAGVQASALGVASTFPAVSLSSNTVQGIPPDIQPDTQMAAGPDNLVEVVNAGELTVWSRTGALMMTRDLNVEFGVLPGFVLADARILFDAGNGISGRWFLSSLAFDSTTNTSMVYLAVSASANPQAGWKVYTVVTKTFTLTDQPKVGVAFDKVVLSWSDFDLALGAPGTYTGAETWVYTKSELVAGSLGPNEVHFPPNPKLFDLVPAQALEPPTTATTAYLAYDDSCGGPTITTGTCTTGSSALGVVAITGTPGATPNNVIWTDSNPAMAPTSFPPPALQPGVAPLLSAGDDRLLSAVWRNNKLWAAGNDACTPNGDSVVRSCFKVIEASTATGPVSVVQTLDIGSLGGYLLDPALTVDTADNMFVAGSLSSATQSPSVVAYSLAPGPTGALSEVTVQRGAGSYDCQCGLAPAPWGEYSAAALDPVSPSTVWVAGEYGAALGALGEWGTVIGEVSLLPASATTLNSSPNPSALMAPVTFTATVTPLSATGTVTFWDGAANLGSASVNGGVASFTTTTPLSGSTHPVTAFYSGDTTNAPSVSDVLSQVVNLTPTSTALNSSLNPSVFGQPVTLTATVTTGTSTVATGVVDFMDGGVRFGTANLDINGVASFTTTAALTGGTHRLTAAYSGDTTYASSSGPLSQLVTQAPSSTALNSSVASSSFGQPVTFTATVTTIAMGAGVPTGQVQFKAGASLLAGCAPVTLNTGGLATCTTSSLAVGSYTITGDYLANGNFTASQATLTQDVVRASTSTLLTSSANPALVGTPITFTAKVTPVAPGAGVPIGQVQFSANTKCALVYLDNAGVATCTAVSLAAGSPSITANYLGDSSFASSASVLLTQVVGQAPTTTTLTSSANPGLVGQSVTFTAKVTTTAMGAGVPSGQVVFSVDTGCASVTLDTGGVATCTTSSLAVGSHNITANYLGDGNFTASASGGLSQVVVQASSTVLTSSGNPAVIGQSVTFTAKVTPVAPGVGVPTGQVQFSADGTVLAGCATVTLDSAGGATCVTSSLAIGSHSISATYLGDGSFTASKGALTQVTDAVHGIVMDAYGGLHPFGSGTVNTTGAPYWPGWKIARAVAMIPDGSGGYLLDGWGGIHSFGVAPTVTGTAYWQGWDIARGIVLNPCDPNHQSGYVLDGFGGVHPFGGALPVTTSGYSAVSDIAKALAVNSCPAGVVSGYVLDGFGGVHNFSSNGVISTPVTTAYWGGWNIARGIVVSGDGQGYVLDGFGGLHSFGGAPAIAASSYWSGWDIARGIAYDSRIGGGYVLDGWGGLHQFGNAPSVSTGAYWSGWDIARGVITG